jgi:cell division GTPase FtsZ
MVGPATAAAQPPFSCTAAPNNCFVCFLQVVGVGGAASKIVQQLWQAVPQQDTMDCIIMDIDAEALFSSPMPNSRKLLLGSNFQQFLRTPSWNSVLGREGVGKVSFFSVQHCAAHSSDLSTTTPRTCRQVGKVGMSMLTCGSCSSTAEQASALQSAEDISEALEGAEVVMVVVSPCL